LPAVTAGNGNVSIYLGSGNDTATAGPGHDRFIFANPDPQLTEITNFNPSIDKIVLSKKYFPLIGPVGHPLAAADFHVGVIPDKLGIFYVPSHGSLWYDYIDGLHAFVSLQFATFTTHPVLTHADFIVEA
jgi:hypothetical protein